MASEIDKFFPEQGDLEDEILLWVERHSEEFSAQLKELGHDNPDIPMADPRILEEQLRKYENDIKFWRDKLQSKFAEKVSEADSQQARERAAKRFKDRYLEGRLNLIRGQNQEKISQKLDEQRQKDFGIIEYVWKTVSDGRVRDSHVKNDGKPFLWSDPSPITGHPGHDFGCRCRAVPNFPFGQGRDAINSADFGPIELVGAGVAKLGREGAERVSKVIQDKLKERGAREAIEEVVKDLRKLDWKLGDHKSLQKWRNRMARGKWDEQGITDTINKGKAIEAPHNIDKINGKATRYEYKGRFVVRDDKTGEILQISRDNIEPEIIK